jgi:hypothetical protein
MITPPRLPSRPSRNTSDTGSVNTVVPCGASAAGAAVSAPRSTRSMRCASARVMTLITASGFLPPADSRRNSVTPNRRCSGLRFCTMFWMRPYGMCRSVRFRIPSRTSSSPSPSR